MTPNERLAEASRVRQIKLFRQQASVRAEIEKLLAALGDELAASIARTAPMEPARQPYRRARLDAVIDRAYALIADAYKGIRSYHEGDLKQLAEAEALWLIATVNEIIGRSAAKIGEELDGVVATVRDSLIAGAPVRDWWATQSTTVQRNFAREMRIGLVGGETDADLIKRARRQVDVSRRWAKVLVRGASSAVTSQVRKKAVLDNPRVFSGIQQISVFDGRTSDTCIAYAGKVWSLPDFTPIGHSLPYNGGVPRHPNCLTGDALVLPCGDIAGVSKRWFDGEVFVIRTASGNKLTCTPNHPILTDCGWVRAQALNLGSKVVSHRLGEGPSFLNGDGKHVPTRIHEIAESALSSPQMVARPVPTSAEDFHGDGMNGEVAVVWANRKLMSNYKAALSEHLSKAAFVMRDMVLTLGVGMRSLHAFAQTALSPSHSLMCSGCEAGAFGWGGSAHPSKLLGASIAQGNTVFDKDTLDGTWRDAEFIRDATDTDAIGVFFDDICDIQVTKFSGHVYNLQTDKSIYIANGIVNHNCRSTEIAVLTDGEPAEDVTFEQFLEGKSAAYVDSLLGRGKAKLYRDGHISLSDLVDQQGRALTLAQLTEE